MRVSIFTFISSGEVALQIGMIGLAKGDTVNIILRGLALDALFEDGLNFDEFDGFRTQGGALYLVYGRLGRDVTIEAVE